MEDSEDESPFASGKLEDGSPFDGNPFAFRKLEDGSPFRSARSNSIEEALLRLKGTYSGKEIIKSESVQDFNAINQSELINVALAKQNLERLGFRLVRQQGAVDWINQPSEKVSLRTALCCMTCKRQLSCSRQFPGSKSFCPCHRKLTSIIGGPKSPRWNPFGEGTSTMHNDFVSDFNVEIGLGHTLRHPTLIGTMQLTPIIGGPKSPRWNPFGEGTSTMHNDFASDFDVEIGLGHTLRRPTLIGTIPNVSDSQASESPPTVASVTPPTVKNHTQHWVLNVPFKDGDIQTGGTPTSVRGQGEPPLVLQGDSSSQAVGHEDSNIQPQGEHSSDRVPSEQRLGDSCFYHHAHEDNWQRLTTMVDPLLAVNVQGACSLVAYKKSDGSSPAKDVLFYFIVIVYVLGFLSAFASKWFRCYKMGVIGLVATVLGFLMTLALVIIYKIG